LLGACFGQLATSENWQTHPQLRRKIQRDMENAIAAGRAGQANELELERMRLQLEVLRRKRLELAGLVVDGEVADSTLWEVQRLLDFEEARLENLLAGAEVPPPLRSAQVSRNVSVRAALTTR
jgi:hypothetical protein